MEGDLRLVELEHGLQDCGCCRTSRATLSPSMGADLGDDLSSGGAGPLVVLPLVPRGVPVKVVAADLVAAKPLCEDALDVCFLKLGHLYAAASALRGRSGPLRHGADWGIGP